MLSPCFGFGGAWTEPSHFAFVPAKDLKVQKHEENMKGWKQMGWPVANMG